MQFTPALLGEWSHTRQTTRELAQAILENARDEEHADEIWMADYDDDALWRIIEDRAWELVDNSDDPTRKVLRCGQGRFSRETARDHLIAEYVDHRESEGDWSDDEAAMTPEKRRSHFRRHAETLTDEQLMRACTSYAIAANA